MSNKVLKNDSSPQALQALKVSTAGVMSIIVPFVIITIVGNSLWEEFSSVAWLSTVMLLTSVITIVYSIGSFLKVRSWWKLIPIVYISLSLVAILIACFYIASFGF